MSMPYIEQIPLSEADGLLKKQFDAAIDRAGRVWNIVHVTVSYTHLTLPTILLV